MYISLKKEEELKNKYRDLYVKYNHGLKKIYKRKFIKWYENISFLVSKNNHNYLTKLIKNNFFLNNIDGVSLDKLQKEVVLSEEENTLVIAGAGSGKTLTLLAKIIYLVNNGVNPKDILCLSFTNASADNLTKKLKNHNIEIKALTFHKLGMNILKNNGYRYKIVNEKVLDNIVSSIDYLKVREIIDLKFTTIDYEGNYCNDIDLLKMQENIFKNSDYFMEIKNTIITFINLFKSNNYQVSIFDKFLATNKLEKNKYTRIRNKKYLLLIKDIYEKYISYLEINSKIDFHDMINKAINVVSKKGIYNYKYIIVDEYQDTSLAKCALLRKIKNKTGAKVIAVGDDWQSIYRFTGTNLQVFTEFNQYFPYTKTFKLTNTYRNSNELLMVMNKFIMQNKKQIPKLLVSNKHLEKPIIIYYYENNQKEVLNKILKKLDNSYFILGRNNDDINVVPKKYQKKFMTVHKSKGMETDISVIINLEDSPLGFPNKIVNDDILKYVSSKDEFPYEEERRLFYVALTRTRSYNILLVNRNNPSPFVSEIMDDSNVNIYN